MDFGFVPASEGGRSGTRVDITIRIPTPPLLGWLAPLLKKQVLREAMAAAEQDKRDIEQGYQPSSSMATQAASA
jgi:hypothetical protein